MLEMLVDVALLTRIARTKSEALRDELKSLCKAEDADIEDARVNKGSIGEGNWKRRYATERKLLATNAVLDALSLESPEAIVAVAANG